jgi:hypothetical protein
MMLWRLREGKNSTVAAPKDGEIRQRRGKPGEAAGLA